MRDWGLFVSRGLWDSEPPLFNEPGLFLISPDGSVSHRIDPVDARGPAATRRSARGNRLVDGQRLPRARRGVSIFPLLTSTSAECAASPAGCWIVTNIGRRPPLSHSFSCARDCGEPGLGRPLEAGGKVGSWHRAVRRGDLDRGRGCAARACRYRRCRAGASAWAVHQVRKPATNASPAPIVSTTSTTGTGTERSPVGSVDADRRRSSVLARPRVRAQAGPARRRAMWSPGGASADRRC